MSTDRDKCGLGSFLPMSCRGRAEAFARHLHSRLRSLGSRDQNGVADENSWLGTHDNPIAMSQPLPTSGDQDAYLDFGDVECPGSPEDKIDDDGELEKLLHNNKDNLQMAQSRDDCPCSNAKDNNSQITLLNNIRSLSMDSDSSDGPFYDVDDSNIRILNGIDHSLGECVEDDFSTKEIHSYDYSNQTDDVYVTTSDCTKTSSSISDDLATLSLKDDCSSLELNGSFSELDKLSVYCSNTSNKQETHPEPVHLNDTEIIREFSKINDTEDEEDEEKTPRVRRCSSLKTGKTPPGTPGQKKIVRFADVLGLDLADVRTFLDDIPKIPTSAYVDLKDADINDEVDSNTGFRDSHSKFHGIKVDKLLVPLFQQPGGLCNFMDRVKDYLVCLENALVEDPVALSIAGTVRVRNLDFHKSVHIRYSLDCWKNFADVQAVYVQNSCDGFSDTFKFIIYAHTLTVGQRLEFAVRFQCKGSQYWDNNNGANYCFQCLPSTNNSPYTPITHDSWGASFYYQEDAADGISSTSSLARTAVQEFITNSLTVKQPVPNKKSDLLVMFIILICSFLLMYVITKSNIFYVVFLRGII